MTQRFTGKAEGALREALAIASALGHTYLGSEHLLYGLAAERDCVASRILEMGGANSDKIKETISLFTGIGRPSTVTGNDMTPRVTAIIAAAGAEAGRSTVGTEHLLHALLTAEECVAKKVLSTIGADVPLLMEEVELLLGGAPKRESKKRNQDRKEALSFSEYGRDLSEAAARGQLDPVIGREREIARLIRVLSRRQKNNPCLIGDPGVGKTAVVEGLAQAIASGKVPEAIAGMRVFSLNLPALIAGAKYRGEFEERMKALLESLRRSPHILLFIDEIHTIVGAGAAEGAIDAANILKPAMARGEIRVIGATTPEEYRRHIERDPALERRFQPVTVEAPNREETKAILEGLRERYERHHGLLISEAAIDAAIDLSIRYIPEHHLPDKALDLLDEAASELRLRQSFHENNQKTLEDIIRQKENEKERAILSADYEHAAKLRDEIGAIESEIESKKAACEAEAEPMATVTPELVAEAVSERTGIPLSRLDTHEAERLARLEADLRTRIIGQEEAIVASCRAVRRARTGMRDHRRPIGSFLFLGPTGVGKTALCRALAESFFGSERSLIRLDMSEYMEKHTLSRLIGSPPVYVGFEEGGQLSDRIRRRPYSLVLFDEIEKAHPDIFHLLLQILEDGILTDSHGRTVEFRHAIIVMTSNLGADNTRHSSGIGFANIDQSISKKEAIYEELKQHFRPELLNRIDEIVIFRHLSKEDIARIADQLLSEIVKRASEAGFLLSIGDDVREWLAEVGYSEEYGARELRRAVVHLLEDRFSEAIVEGQIIQGIPYHAALQNGKITFLTEDCRAAIGG